jgi:hypothetical protein
MEIKIIPCPKMAGKGWLSDLYFGDVKATEARND